jgi:HAD superfamily hydrolase (TIGR01459 family)
MQSVTMIPGLSAIADAYDAVICDVWGVLHNGVQGYPGAVEALTRFRGDGERPVVLLTNAPRPSYAIETMLHRFGVPTDAYDAIVTSGDVMHTLLRRLGGAPAFHIGPARDLPLFEGLAMPLVPEDEGEIVVCTGLFDDETETPDDYRAVLGRLVDRGLPMYCANPDVVVERGDRLIYCAGAVAQLFQELGGVVEIVGKPYKPVYDVAVETIDELAGREVSHRRVLAIGDAFPTDVKGAWGQGLDVLLVTAGIHASDFGPQDAPDPALVARRAAIEGVEIRAALTRLAW